MKNQLVAFVRDIDAFCGRLNAGLTAVAILLGFLVMTMSMIRAQDLVPEMSMTVPVDYQLSSGN